MLVLYSMHDCAGNVQIIYLTHYGTVTQRYNFIQCKDRSVAGRVIYHFVDDKIKSVLSTMC